MRRHRPVDYEARPSALVVSTLRPTSYLDLLAVWASRSIRCLRPSVILNYEVTARSMTWLTVSLVREIPDEQWCTGQLVARRRGRICVTAWTLSAVSNLQPAQGRSAIHRQTRAAKMHSCCCKKKIQVQKLIICCYLQRRMEWRIVRKVLIHPSSRLSKHPSRQMSMPSTLYMANTRRMLPILVTSASNISRKGEKPPMFVSGHTRR